MNAPGLSEERFCRYVEKLINVPIVKMNRDGELLEKYTEIHTVVSLDISKKEIAKALELKVGIIKRDNESVYGSVRDLDANLFFIGPVQTSEEYGKRTQNGVYYCPFTMFIEALLMLYEYLTGIEMEFMEFIRQDENAEFRKCIEKQRSQYHFNQQENRGMHNSYLQEQREQNAIREGNIEKLKDAFGEPVIGRLGVSSKNRMRSAKNNCLTVIAISTRSAIEGGLDSEEVFRLSDTYMTQIENQNDIEKLITVTRNAEIELTKLVAQHKKEQVGKNSPYIDKCKRYIYQHLHEKISVAEIAWHIGVTESYLSNVFRQAENVTITEYIMRTKIYYAQNLLTYSDYSYNEIAYYFGFSSRSHFGAVFKKITGLTPKQYRDRNQAKEFFEERGVDN